MKPSYSSLEKAIPVYLLIEDLESPLIFEHYSGTSEGNTVIHSTGGETGGVSTSCRRFTYNAITAILFYNLLSNKLPFS